MKWNLLTLSFQKSVQCSFWAVTSLIRSELSSLNESSSLNVEISRVPSMVNTRYWKNERVSERAKGREWERERETVKTSFTFNFFSHSSYLKTEISILLIILNALSRGGKSFQPFALFHFRLSSWINFHFFLSLKTQVRNILIEGTTEKSFVTEDYEVYIVRGGEGKGNFWVDSWTFSKFLIIDKRIFPPLFEESFNLSWQHFRLTRFGIEF